MLAVVGTSVLLVGMMPPSGAAPPTGQFPGAQGSVSTAAGRARVTPPGAPTKVGAVEGNAGATVSWSAPTSDGGSVITGYVIEPSKGRLLSVGNVTSAAVTGLTNGTTYTFAVAATNSAGTGPASQPSNPVTPSAPPTRAAFLIPLYDASSVDWSSACGDLSDTSSFVVADIGDPGGPGTSSSASWATDIGDCDAEGVGVLGYVDTGYCTVPLATAESQVTSWYQWYGDDGIKGIFFDEVDNPVNAASAADCLLASTSATSYYETLASFVHAEASGQTVAYNFGTNPTSAWALSSGVARQNANIAVVFENVASAYTGWSPSSWESSYPSSEFSVLLYGDTNPNDPAASCSLIAQQKVGYVFITPEGGWTSLPPAGFFGAELADC